MLNNCTHQGRFAADPVMRQTTSGLAVASFRLAVERDFKDQQTGRREADWLDFVAWRTTAEFVCRNFSKGQLAIVESHTQTRKYTDKNGNNRTATEFVVDKIFFCGARNEAPAQGGYQQEAEPAAPAAPAYAAGSNDDFTEIPDDEGDLPF